MAYRLLEDHPVYVPFDCVGENDPLDPLFRGVIGRLTQMAVFQRAVGRLDLDQEAEFVIDRDGQVAVRPTNLVLTRDVAVFVVAENVGQYVSDDGHVPLSIFLHQLQAFVSAINRADELASGGNRSTYARVVDLTHSSPATVTVELLPIRPEADTRQRVLDVLRGVNDLDSMGDSSRQLLRAFSELSEPVGRRIRSTTVRVNGEAIELSQELKHRIGVILEAEESAWGSIDGRLEAINVHDQANIFYIYPIIGPTRIKCHFPELIRKAAVTSVDREIRVSGTLRYKARAPFPYEIEVENLEALPNDDELPTLASLRGISPNATDGVLSEVFVRRLRDAWG